MTDPDHLDDITADHDLVDALAAGAQPDDPDHPDHHLLRLLAAHRDEARQTREEATPDD